MANASTSSKMKITRARGCLARVIGRHCDVASRPYGIETLVASPELVMVKTPVVDEA